MDSGNASTDSSAPGTESGLPRVAGYEVLRRLAVDATSDVVLARAQGPTGLEQVVVLNILIEPWREDDEALRVLAREVDGYRRLTHPAVARLYAFLADGDHRVVVLEYVDGVALHRLRALLKTHGKALSDQASIYIAWRVFSALAAAHGALDSATGRVRSVVHKDVNPSHVLVPWDGHVKLGNFGIAVALQHGDRAASGLLQGTYGYAAPEQAKGGAASTRSDVYSAGLLLWELLAGRKAIVRGAGHEASVVAAVAKAEFPALAELRPDLSKTVLTAVSRALEPDPDRRTIDAQSMCDVLRTSGNLEDGRVALVESLSVVRPPAVADMLIEAPARAKAPSELWLEPTRKVDVPVYLGGVAKPEGSPAPESRDPATLPKDRASPTPAAPASRRPGGALPIVLRMGVPRPRESEQAASAAASAPVHSPPPSRGPTPLPPFAASPPLGPSPIVPRAAAATLASDMTPLAPAVAVAPSVTQAASTAPAASEAPVATPVAPIAPAPVADPWFQNESQGVVPVGAPSTPSFQPPPPSPLPPESSPPPPAGVRSRRLSPVVWGLPVVVVVGAVVMARQPWKSSDFKSPNDRQVSAGTFEAGREARSSSELEGGRGQPASSILRADSRGLPADRGALLTPVELVPPPTFAAADAALAENRPDGARLDRSPPLARPGTGTVTVGPARPGHRVWIDEHLMAEESPASYSVPCGRHLVQVGSHGTPQTVDVPCGADIEIR